MSRHLHKTDDMIFDSELFDELTMLFTFMLETNGTRHRLSQGKIDEILGVTSADTKSATIQRA